MPFSRPGFALVPVTSPMRMSGQRGNALAGKSVAGHLQFIRQGNALDASTYAGGPWDGILLLVTLLPPAMRGRIGSAVLQQACAHLAPERLALRRVLSRALLAFWWGARASPGGHSGDRSGPNIADPRHRVQLRTARRWRPAQLLSLRSRRAAQRSLPMPAWRSPRLRDRGPVWTGELAASTHWKQHRSRGMAAFHTCTIARSQALVWASEHILVVARIAMTGPRHARPSGAATRSKGRQSGSLKAGCAS